jgi:hypothetical protein
MQFILHVDKKNPRLTSRIFYYEVCIYSYAFPAAAIKFKAEPATNQPI